VQVVSVYLQAFCAIYSWNVRCSQKLQKKSLKSSFRSCSRSFKVIDVDKAKKPVTSACYDKQHVCTYLQPFSHYTSQQQQKNIFLGGTPLWCPSSRGTPSPRATKFCHDKLEAFWQLYWRFHDFSLHHFDTIQQCDRQMLRSWLRSAKHSAIACKNP